jgi:tRNA dimethylallyltransferase
MESVANNSPVIVVLGQTASGKSALALELAQRFGGEIIAADSRTVYKGMDIGTAKSTLAEQRLVRHHLIDVVEPDQSFSVADFQYLARKAIDDIASRGRLPMLVGGSGLYIDSVIYDFSFRQSGDLEQRKVLGELSVEELQAILLQRAIPFPANERNPRHLVRSLETAGEIPCRAPLRPNTLVIGIFKDRALLANDVLRRVDSMVDRGFVKEVKHLAARYGWDVPALQAPGYRAFRLYLAGQVSLEEAKRQFVQNDLQYAKRQKTWFKRNMDIHWISNLEEAVDIITTFLNK